MSNTAINTLKYTGIVTLSQYIGSKKFEIAKIHNAGGNPLFNFLSDCLVGDFDIARLSRPTKIMLLDKDTDGSYISKSGFIYLISKPEKDSNSHGTVHYNFTVARDVLDGTSFSSIGLYTDNTSTSDVQSFAAVCDVDLSVYNLSSSSALLIDWELNISNR